MVAEGGIEKKRERDQERDEQTSVWTLALSNDSARNSTGSSGQ